MQIFHVQFTNGVDHRSYAELRPDIVFAMMAAQRLAPGAFAQRWNGVADKSRWKIVVRGRRPGERYEELARA